MALTTLLRPLAVKRRAQPGPRRRWQYSLRSLLVLMITSNLALAWLGTAAREHRNEQHCIRELVGPNGHLFFDEFSAMVA